MLLEHEIRALFNVVVERDALNNRVISASDDSRVDSLLSGSKWGAGSVGTPVTITYSFPGQSSVWQYTEEVNAGYTGLNSSQQSDFRAALDSWAEVSQIAFVEVADGTTYGDIRVAFTQAISGNTLGYAYLPGSGSVSGSIISPSAAAGDVWLNPTLTDLSSGSVGYSTLIHEVGHALGLKHSFEAEDGFPSLSTEFDTTQYTVMSYTDYDGAGYVFEEVSGGYYTYQAVQAETPMVYDILAAQYMYGVDTTTRTGDDTYTFSVTAQLKTIWDAGGTDTIDLSNQQVSADLNLEAGSYSDIGQRQMTYSGPLTQAEDNIAIAFGVTIENAIGTSYDDFLAGNAANNVLEGGGGNDQLDGKSGVDTAVFNGSKSAYTIAQNTQGNATVIGTDGSDQLENIERLSFSDINVALDLDGNAGAVAKIIGAVFGAASVQNQNYMGIGIRYLDSGNSSEELMALAMNAAGVTTNESVVDRLYLNVVGIAPSDSVKSSFVQRLESGEFTNVSLGIMASELALNTQNINLTGLTTSGVEYI